jgi:hypothetical protein
MSRRAYRVRRLVQGAEGTNTINIYNPLEMVPGASADEPGQAGASLKIEENVSSFHAGMKAVAETSRFEAAHASPGAHEIPKSRLLVRDEPVRMIAGISHEPPAETASGLSIQDQHFDMRAAMKAEEQGSQVEASDVPPVPAANVVAAMSPAPVSARLDVSSPAPPQTRRPSPAPEFERDIDAEVMAEAMREAARTGAPFCEKCTRARMQQAAEARVRQQAVPAPPLPAAPPPEPRVRQQAVPAPRPVAPPAQRQDPEMADVDAAAMADAMRDAARQGAPFCEKCTRARLRAGREGMKS